MISANNSALSAKRTTSCKSEAWPGPFAFTSAPCFKRNSTISARPVKTASRSGVSPDGFETRTSAPLATSSSANLMFPVIIARCSGPSPWRSAVFTFAPRAIRNSTAVSCPARTAASRGVERNGGVRASSSAPRPSKNSSIAVSPVVAARCNGVRLNAVIRPNEFGLRVEKRFGRGEIAVLHREVDRRIERQ